jgi:AraC-like DNA-binding protein
MAVGESAALFRPAGEEHEDLYHKATASLSLLFPAESAAASFRTPFMMRDPGFASLAAVLRREIATTDTASPLLMEGLALLTVSKVLHCRPLQGRGVPRWIGTVRDRVEAEYAKPPTLANLGRMVHRDAAYVAATFKRVYGNSVGVYVRYLRLWQARRYIDADPECPLSDVAQRCGFADQSHFNRHFRRLFAVTPGEYRERYRPGLAQVA